MGVCLEKTAIPVTGVRFPGETCGTGLTCFSDPFTANGGVVNTTCPATNICVGVAAGAACQATNECVVGNYCKGFVGTTTNGTCTAQVASGGDCADTYDCQNGFFCYNKKCQAFGSIVSGTGLTSDALGAFLQDGYLNYVCEYAELGYLNKTVCSRSDYGVITAPQVKDSAGYVNCTRASDCNYVDIQNATFTRKCQCGYNAAGAAYCPTPKTVGTADWLAQAKNYASYFTNTCHSRNRFACYVNRDSQLSSHLSTVKKTDQANLYYNAVPCAMDVLSGSYIKMSLAAFMVILAFIF